MEIRTFVFTLLNPVMIKADYWKSQTRKYCDFCKCWIADNKPSVEFHEKGRRHKENVAKRLKHITKKSRQNELSTLKVDAAIAQMESAAMEAYQRDVQCNPDLTSIAINNKIGVVKKLWQEAETDTGQKYYYHTLTKETVWAPPKEDYLKIGEDQEEDFRKQWKEYHRKQLLQQNLRNEEAKHQKEEERAKEQREKLKSYRVEDIPEPAPAPLIPEGRTNPYGQWTTVIARPVERRSASFETQNEDEKPLLHEELPVKVFKEKTVQSLGEASGSTSFKKRKFVSGNKGNARARLDVD